MAPSPFAVKLSVGGAVGAVMAVNAVMASGAVGGELEAGCEALGALLLAPLGAELGDSL